jgi:hypothetical protein
MSQEASNKEQASRGIPHHMDFLLEEDEDTNLVGVSVLVNEF